MSDFSSFIAMKRGKYLKYEVQYILGITKNDVYSTYTLKMFLNK